jgi:hypothetical protein
VVNFLIRALSVALALSPLIVGVDSVRAAPARQAPAFVPGAMRPGNLSNPSEERRMRMTVGERHFAITLTDNTAARAFAAEFPLALKMSDLNGNEKKASLPRALPATASRPGTIRTGDIMLYGDNTLVVFYLTFDSPYAYTRLGRVDDPAGLAEALGKGSVTIVFSAP